MLDVARGGYPCLVLQGLGSAASTARPAALDAAAADANLARKLAISEGEDCGVMDINNRYQRRMKELEAELAKLKPPSLDGKAAQTTNLKVRIACESYQSVASLVRAYVWTVQYLLACARDATGGDQSDQTVVVFV